MPSTVLELEQVLLGFVPFTLSFGALIFIWSVHRAFFRRFPLGDRLTVALNSCLLFVALFYVYPLKFLARGLATMLFGRGIGGGGGVASFAELGKLFAWYGAGFAAIFLFVALLYLHGARQAEGLGLSLLERQQARFWARHYAILVPSACSLSRWRSPVSACGSACPAGFTPSSARYAAAARLLERPPRRPIRRPR